MPSVLGRQSALSRLSAVSPAPEATAMATKKRSTMIAMMVTPLFRLLR
jgi:hypothetical protein